jgi:hypothetical protein
VSVSGIGREQLGLFGGRHRPADRMLDAVEDRFGEGTLTRASRLRPSGDTSAAAVRDRKGSRRLLK